jgi:aspartyl-tRNA(Asn)/glutamyl-tRNA(Gln) amidotransferase subunit A
MGAIPIGKTATAEFGFDPATRPKAFGPTRNPWNLERTSGGSSGGSSSAVAGGLVPFAWGGDGGGSIRLPAAYTGLVGLKPNHGRIGKPAGGDFTVHGVLTTTVGDTARVLDAVAGPAATDKSSLEPPRVRYEDAIESLDVRKLRVIWTDDLGGYVRCVPEVARVARAAAEQLVEAAGLELVETKLTLNEHPVRAWRSLARRRARSSKPSSRSCLPPSTC